MDFASFSSLKVSQPTSPHIVELELDHGKTNEMGRAQLSEIDKLAGWLHDAGDVRALITYSRKTSGKGTPIFQAGANVAERVGWGDDEVKRHVRWQREVLMSLRRVPLFHIIVVQGVAFGWGCEYTLCGDWVIATDAARFALPETGLGIVPGAGGTSEMFERIGSAHTLRLGMTGETIGPAEALRIGLVSRCVDDDAVLDTASRPVPWHHLVRTLHQASARHEEPTAHQHVGHREDEHRRRQRRRPIRHVQTRGDVRLHPDAPVPEAEGDEDTLGRRVGEGVEGPRRVDPGLAAQVSSEADHITPADRRERKISPAPGPQVDLEAAEGDVIVTETGCELITRGVPVKADEIEALMKA